MSDQDDDLQGLQEQDARIQGVVKQLQEVMDIAGKVPLPPTLGQRLEQLHKDLEEIQNHSQTYLTERSGVDGSKLSEEGEDETQA